MSGSSFPTFGRYEVVKQIADTGLSTIYKAILPPATDKFYAIKTMSERAPFNAPDLILSKEIAIVEKLKGGPYIVQYVYDSLDNGKRYLVMDYVEGTHPLKGYSKGSKPYIKPDLIKTFVVQVAKALKYAHENGICHCDVRPDNIFIVQDKDVILFDFGLAVEVKGGLYKYEEGDERRNLDHQLTRTYFSPQHFTDGMDPTGDQYSLALVVIQCLCGELPPSVNDPDIKKKQEGIKKIFSSNPRVANVLNIALENNPNKRYQSIEIFAGELVKALDADAGNSQQKATHADMDATDTADALPNSPSASSQLDASNHSPSISITAQPKNSLRTFGRRSLITMALSGAIALPLTWVKLWPRLFPRQSAAHFGDPIGVYLGHRNIVNALAWSPDGQWIASASADNTLQVWKPSSENERIVFPCPDGNVTDVAWSTYPNTSIIAFSSGRYVYIWDFINSTIPQKIYPAPSAIKSVAWSPWLLNSSPTLAIVGDHSLVQVLQFEGNNLNLPPASASYDTRGIKPNTQFSDVAWSWSQNPDTTYLAVCSKSTSPYVWAWNFKNGDPQTPLMPGLRSGVLSIAWSPESTDMLAVGHEGSDPYVQVWSNVFEDGNQPINYHYSGLSQGIDQIAWSPPGPSFTTKTYIAAGSEVDGIICVWNAEKKRVPDTYDGHRLSFIDSQRFNNNSIDIKALAWSPDGTMIASGGTDSTVLVWQSGIGTF